MALRAAAAFSRRHAGHINAPSAVTPRAASFSLRLTSQCNGLMSKQLISDFSVSTTARTLSTIPLRQLSTTAESSSATKEKIASSKKEAKKSDSNIFLDNLGKFFLSGISMIVLALVRSSYGTSNKNKLRDDLEETAALDPMEVDDLRVANSEMSPEMFTEIVQVLYQSFPMGTVTYADFVKTVRTTMTQAKGDAFTIELGHLIDRATLSGIKDQGKTPEDAMPIAFFLAALSLALSCSVQERIILLYTILERSSSDVFSADTQNVTLEDVVSMVSYLQDTCQLPPDTQVITSDVKYPIQEYKRGAPEELVLWGDEKNGLGASNQEVIDCEAFAAILQSKSVCAWGECYSRKKKLPK